MFIIETHSRRLLRGVGLGFAALALSTGAAAQDDCGGADFFGGTISAAESSIESDGDFCGAGIGGSQACAGDTVKIPHVLLLDSTEGVDLTCETDAGTLCVMEVGCETLLGERIADGEVRVRSPLPSTELRILIADDESGDAICNALILPMVTCEGSFGSPGLIFESGFEAEDPHDFADWAGLLCPDCTGAVTDPLTLSPAAARNGELGLESTYTGSPSPAFLLDDSPSSESRYVAIFEVFVTTSFEMADRKKHPILRASHLDTGQVVFEVFLLTNRRGKLKLMVRARDGGGWRKIGQLTLKPRRWTRVVVDWRAATAAGADDGRVSFQVKNKSRSKQGLANGVWRIDEVRFGQVLAPGSAASGAVYFDDFESRRSF